VALCDKSKHEERNQQTGACEAKKPDCDTKTHEYWTDPRRHEKHCVALCDKSKHEERNQQTGACEAKKPDCDTKTHEYWTDPRRHEKHCVALCDKSKHEERNQETGACEAKKELPECKGERAEMLDHGKPVCTCPADHEQWTTQIPYKQTLCVARCREPARRDESDGTCKTHHDAVKCDPPRHLEGNECKCAVGQHWDETSKNCLDDHHDQPVTHDCPAGQHWDEAAKKCGADHHQTNDCPAGQHWDAAAGACAKDVVPINNSLLDCPSGDSSVDGNAETSERADEQSPEGKGELVMSEEVCQTRKNRDARWRNGKCTLNLKKVNRDSNCFIPEGSRLVKDGKKKCWTDSKCPGDGRPICMGPRKSVRFKFQSGFASASFDFRPDGKFDEIVGHVKDLLDEHPDNDVNVVVYGSASRVPWVGVQGSSDQLNKCLAIKRANAVLSELQRRLTGASPAVKFQGNGGLHGPSFHAGDLGTEDKYTKFQYVQIRVVTGD
jgi:hypothetical protein